MNSLKKKQFSLRRLLVGVVFCFIGIVATISLIHWIVFSLSEDELTRKSDSTNRLLNDIQRYEAKYGQIPIPEESKILRHLVVDRGLDQQDAKKLTEKLLTASKAEYLYYWLSDYPGALLGNRDKTISQLGSEVWIPGNNGTLEIHVDALLPNTLDEIFEGFDFDSTVSERESKAKGRKGSVKN